MFSTQGVSEVVSGADDVQKEIAGVCVVTVVGP